MELVNSIFSLIGILIWPAIALTVFLCLRRHLIKILKKAPKLLERTKGIEYAGLKIDCPILGSAELINIGDGEQYSRIYESALILAEENTIKGQIESAKLSNEQATKALIYQLAHKNFIIKFLEIERLIFPHQISVLEFLKEKFSPVPDKDLMDLYNKLNKIEYNCNYKNFIGYMINKSLIQITIDGFIISILGREYLIFRAKIGGFAKRPEAWRDKVSLGTTDEKLGITEP